MNRLSFLKTAITTTLIVPVARLFSQTKVVPKPETNILTRINQELTLWRRVHLELVGGTPAFPDATILAIGRKELAEVKELATKSIPVPRPDIQDIPDELLPPTLEPHFYGLVIVKLPVDSFLRVY